MTRKKTIKIPIYFGDLVLCTTDDFDKIGKEYNLVFPVGRDAFIFDDHDEDGYTRYFVVFNDKSVPFKHIAHESLHIVTHIFKDRFITIDCHNDEPATYLLGWVVDQIVKFLKSNKVKIE